MTYCNDLLSISQNLLDTRPMHIYSLCFDLQSVSRIEDSRGDNATSCNWLWQTVWC